MNQVHGSFLKRGGAGHSEPVYAKVNCCHRHTAIVRLPAYAIVLDSCQRETTTANLPAPELPGGGLVEYRGYEIQIETFPDPGGSRATYRVHCGSEQIIYYGTVAGSLQTVADAEREAYGAACRQIDGGMI